MNPVKNSYDDFIKYHYSNSKNDNLNIEEIDQNILTRNDNICHAISNYKEMSSGLAVDIRNTIDNYDILKSTKSDLRDILHSTFKKNYKIFHIITKENFWDKPTYHDLYYSLVKLKDILSSQNIESISFPKIGCGLDQLNWNKVKTMIYFIFLESKIKITICYNKIISLNQEDISKILVENHDSPQAGHSGFHRTYNRIKLNYHWKNMKHDIRNYIKKCESCQKKKISRQRALCPMEITSTSEKPFQRVAMDIVGPLPLSENGNKYILTLQDDLTKYSQAYAIPNHESKTIADKFVNQFICKFGIPDSIFTDQGKDFTSNLLKDVAKLFKIKQIQTTAYHPQSNGALERSHATLADYLKHYVNDKQSNWDDWIDMSMFSYNSTPHTSTKYTPHELVFGYKPNLPTSITQKPEFKYTYSNYIDHLKLKLNRSQEIARNNLLYQKQKSKDIYDRKSNNNIKFKINDQVYLRNIVTKLNQSKKLTSNYNGPFKIIEINSPVNCTILVKNKKSKSTYK